MVGGFGVEVGWFGWVGGVVVWWCFCLWFVCGLVDVVGCALYITILFVLDYYKV